MTILTTDLKDALQSAFLTELTETMWDNCAPNVKNLLREKGKSPGDLLFIDSDGSIDAESVATHIIRSGLYTGTPESARAMIEDAYSSWYEVKGKELVRPYLRRSSVSRPQPVEPVNIETPTFDFERPQNESNTDDFVEDTIKTMDTMTRFERAQRQYNDERRGNIPQPAYSQGGSDTAIVQAISALAPLLAGSNKSSVDPLMMQMMKANQDARSEANAQLIAMFNMAQQNTNQWMQVMLQKSDREGRSSVEDRLLNRAVDEMFEPKATGTERGLFKEVLESGVIGELAGALQGFSQIRNQAAPSSNQPNYGETEAALEPPAPITLPEPAVEREVTTEEKKTAIMESIYDSIPAEWKGDKETLNALMQSVDVAIHRAEARIQTDLAGQLQFAERELAIVMNLRQIGNAVLQIEDGALPLASAKAMLENHPLYPQYASYSFEELISMLSDYEEAVVGVWDSDIRYFKSNRGGAIVRELIG